MSRLWLLGFLFLMEGCGIEMTMASGGSFSANVMEGGGTLVVPRGQGHRPRRATAHPYRHHNRASKPPGCYVWQPGRGRWVHC